MKKTVVLALALAFASQSAFADNFLSTRVGYNENGVQNDTVDNKWDVTAPANVQSTVSAPGADIQRSATATGYFDPTTGTFKGSTQSSLSGSTGDRRFIFAESGVNVADKLRVNSTADNAQLKFTVKYDAKFGNPFVSSPSNIFSSSQPIRSNLADFDVSLSQMVDHPGEGEGSGTWAEMIGGQSGRSWHFAEFTRPEHRGDSNIAYSHHESYSGDGRNADLGNAASATDWSGMISFTLDVPTNKDLDLSVKFALNSFCAQAYLCNSSIDATNSFYLGVTAIGGQLVSNSGYNYTLGAPVPEPESYAMLLAGLGLMGFVARRKARKSV